MRFKLNQDIRIGNAIISEGSIIDVVTASGEVAQDLDFQPVIDELASIIGFDPNIQFAPEEISRGIKINVTSDSFVDKSGVFKHVLKRLEFEDFGSDINLNDDGSVKDAWVNINLRYTNKSGGGNGQDFLTCIYKNGEWSFR